MGNFSLLSNPFSSKLMNSNNNNDHHLNKHNNELSSDLVCMYSDAIEAIEQNDYSKLNQLMEQFDLVDLLNKDSLGNMLLKACEINAQIYIAILLIKYGSNINYSSPDQSTTCLMMAARNDNRPVLNLLLQNGAKVNVQDKYGWTALFYASYFGHANCAEVLLERGAHINLVDQDGMSCLIWAAGRGHHLVVDLLIKHGASVNVADRYNTSALIWACRKGNTDIARLLLDNGALIDEPGMYGWTPLVVAVKGNHIELTRLLLSLNCNVNICDGEKMSPLLIACSENFQDIALDLIEYGASVNQPDKQGNTPLILAAMNKCPRIVEALLNAGAYLEHSNQDERNAIHWAVIKNDIESCKMFLEHGIDVNFTTSSGETYLLLAAKHNSWDIIKLLHEYNGVEEEKQQNENMNGGKKANRLHPESARKLSAKSPSKQYESLEVFFNKPN